MSPIKMLNPYHEMLCILQYHRLSAFTEACIDLEIFDSLAEGGLQVDELSRRTGTDRRALRRCLRALAHFGLFAHSGDDGFELTAVSRPLIADTAFSIQPWHKLHRLLKPEAPDANQHLIEMLRTGKSLFQIKYGCLFYEYLNDNQDIAQVFDKAMESASQMEVADILAAFDFSSSTHLTEIAGGNGALISGVLETNQHMTGQLFDRPHVVERFTPMQRLTVSGVDMHAALPDIPGDAMMKRIMHSYSDEVMSNILSNIGRHMHTGKKLYVFELIDDPQIANPYIGTKHLQMLNVHGAPGESGGPGERTRAEFESLLNSAGFDLIETHHLNSIDAVVAQRR